MLPYRASPPHIKSDPKVQKKRRRKRKKKEETLSYQKEKSSTEFVFRGINLQVNDDTRLCRKHEVSIIETMTDFFHLPTLRFMRLSKNLRSALDFRHHKRYL